MQAPRTGTAAAECKHGVFALPAQLIARKNAEAYLMEYGITLASDIDECFATIRSHGFDGNGNEMFAADDLDKWLGMA